MKGKRLGSLKNLGSVGNLGRLGPIGIIGIIGVIGNERVGTILKLLNLPKFSSLS